mmetsp:Transcript_5801/g.18262  ORF Transcript_5801/g.18262 Transcript_5801/m.18262 type:complete len:346 (-) Transcript_5801:18-1055(-)
MSHSPTSCFRFRQRAAKVVSAVRMMSSGWAYWPMDSMVNLTRVLSFCTTTPRSSFSTLTHSRHSVHFSALRTRAAPSSMAKTFVGHASTTRWAAAPVRGLVSDTSVFMSYQHAETGAHLAWASPRPLIAYACSLMRCPRPSFASRMSWCTSDTAFASASASCPGSGTHCRLLEKTLVTGGADGSLGTATSRSKRRTCRGDGLAKSGVSAIVRNSKASAGAATGHSPRRCDSSSSSTTPSFSWMSTRSMAIVGTSVRITRRSMLAKGAVTFSMSKLSVAIRSASTGATPQMSCGTAWRFLSPATDGATPRCTSCSPVAIVCGDDAVCVSTAPASRNVALLRCDIRQ